MSTLSESLPFRKDWWAWAITGLVLTLILFAIATPNLMRSRMAANDWAELARQRRRETELATSFYQSAAKAKPAAPIASATSDVIASVAQIDVPSSPFDQRMMMRTSSVDLIVQHPSETASQIEKLTERLGGFLETSSGSSADAYGWAMTIRVPSARFDQMRTELRKLGVRIENEKVTSEDVTRQYVDQEANLRNLHAEETQYLAILKQARTVKDMLAVTQQLSSVRGQIERQQAEFNALSKQVETVAITVSLRAEAQAQVFGLHWRPLYQMKLALRDGLDSIANYASIMISLLFYLPAVILWVGTIVGSIVVGWRIISALGRRWFGWQKSAAATSQQA